MHSILFVDDEKAILRSLKRLFYGTGWELFFAEDGTEALEILAEYPIQLVISDMRMPKMDGHRLLHEIHQLHPHTVRIILSGFSDEKEIYRAVLDGSAKNYLFKPWEPEELTSFIRQIFQLRDQLEERNMIKIIDYIRLIPAFQSTKRKLELLFEREAGIAEIAEVIEQDPGISARLLQLINSSSYDKKIGSIKQAVFHIGKNTLKSILSEKSYFMDLDPFTLSGKQDRQVWLHAVLTNTIQKLTYESFLNRPMPDMAVTAGLLHNIGSIMSEDPKQTHEELGSYILRWWGVPQEIVESAQFHHTPFEVSPENFELIGILHLASQYAGSFMGQDWADLDERTFEKLNINRDRYEECIASALDAWHGDQLY